MDLKKRLAQLDRLTRRGGTGSADSAGKSATPARCAADAETALLGLGLIRQEQAAGTVWSLDHVDAMEPPAAELPEMRGLFSGPGVGSVALTNVLFLDTETTGLAGGTGTLVFQVGASWWRQDRLHTRQYFLPGPAAEPAMLAALTALAASFSHVVTFNGASFDLPLLRTRALLNRMDDPLLGLVGWDLLVPVRRLWSNRLHNCRQQTVEAHLCGGVREEGDIDGSRIPQAWFDFLHSGRLGLLANVMTHNHRDMLGMANIFRRVCLVAEWLSKTETGASWPPVGLAADRAGGWALARVCERRLAHEASAFCFVNALAVEWGVLVDEPRRRRFRRDAIRVLKRQRIWELVEELVHEGLEYDSNDMALHTEAAILYEHRLVDLERALTHAQQTGDSHRIARLERLLARDGN